MTSSTPYETVQAEQFRGWEPTAPDPATATRHWVALASLLAGVIHVGMAPGQSEHGAALVLVVFAVGCVQLAFAGVVWRRATVAVALTGIIMHLAVALAHVGIRATGPPSVLTPLSLDGRPRSGHGGVHRIDAAVPADLLATGAGLVALWLLVTLLPRRLRRRTVDVLLVVGVGVWLLRLVLALR